MSSGPVITLRQHVVSLVAVFLALAVGIALGGGPLGGSARSETAASPEGAASDSASDPSAESSAESSDSGGETAYADAFAEAGAARLYAGGLQGHAVAVLALPGVDPDLVKALLAQVDAAGGASTGTYRLAEAPLEADREDDVAELGETLAAQLADPRVDTDEPWDRLGQLLALGMATDQTSSVRADPAAVAVRQALGEAGVLDAPSDVRLAPLVLVLLPPGPEGPPDSDETGEVLGQLVSGLAANATGVVVAGDEASAAGGALAALRDAAPEGTVATVDGLDSTLGQVSTVLALTSVVEGTSGSYGESGADGAVPLP